MMRFPGEVWFLPPDHLRDGDAKYRRHVLLTECEDTGGYATLAYASTRPTEAFFGAANVLLDPGAAAYGRSGRTGFDQPTYVYPSRLICVAGDEMQRFAGRIIDELPDVRAALSHALGIAGNEPVPARGWRGCVIRFTKAVAEEMDCAHGLIVTEPLYARRERYQVVVPLLDLRDFESTERDVVVVGKAWIPLVFGAFTPAVLAVELIQSVFHPTDIVGEIVAVVDAETLTGIDERLRQLFDL